MNSDLNSFVELTLKNGELSSDGTILDRRSSNWDDRIGELALFKRRIHNFIQEESYFDGEISSCVIKESGSLKVNFIPVIADRGDGEEGAMYDKARPNAGPLGNGLFFSSGNGTFGWGELES